MNVIKPTIQHYANGIKLMAIMMIITDYPDEEDDKRLKQDATELLHYMFGRWKKKDSELDGRSSEVDWLSSYSAVLDYASFDSV